MKRKFKNRQSGFSLLEVMIAVGLLSLVSLGFMSMMDNVVRFQRGAQAKDQQKEASSEIRAFLSDPTACLNSVIQSGAVPVANITGTNSVNYTQLRDNANNPRYSAGTVDRSGFLTFQRYQLTQYDAASQSAVLRVVMAKTGSTTGSAEIQDTIFVHVRLNTVAPFNVNYCIAIGKQTDSFWRMTPANTADIFFGDAVVGRVGIGTNAPPTKLAVNGDGLFTSSVAVNTTTPAVVGTQALIVTGNSLFVGRVGVNTSTPVVADPLVVQGNSRIVGGTLGVGTSTPVAGNTAVVAGTTYITGNLGVGTATPSERLVVMGNAQADMFLFNSDQRLKTNIEKSPGLEQIRRLHGHSFNWIKDGRFDTGLIAQEIEQEMPHLVRTSPQGIKSVNYMGLVPVLIEGSKDLYAEHVKLLKRVEQLEKEMKSMKKRRPANEADEEAPSN
jgi:prepilin-type N-terminal cleavage/methylation domain-containing protein